MLHRIIQKFFKNKSQITSFIVLILTLMLLTFVRLISGIRANGFYFIFYDWLYNDILLSMTTVMFGNLISFLVSKYLKKPRACIHMHCGGIGNNRQILISRRTVILYTLITLYFCCILICSCVAFTMYIANCYLIEKDVSIAIAVIFIVNATIANVNFNFITRSSTCCGF